MNLGIVTLPEQNIWISKKTGNEYGFLQYVINATNGQDGHHMVMYYSRYGEKNYIFVRECKEFFEKFEKKEG